MSKWSPKINHLSYADDTILFCSDNRASIIKMIHVLRRYEITSGQLINKVKSFFYLHENTPLVYSIRIRKLAGVKQENFPLIYLGCPVHYGRRNSKHFEDLMRKITRRIFSWQNKFLSFGGRYILLNHVFLSMSIYLLSALTPPKGVIKKLHQIMAKFFWGSTRTDRRKHWVSWEEMCFPKEEGRLRFRSPSDISKAMHAKL